MEIFSEMRTAWSGPSCLQPNVPLCWHDAMGLPDRTERHVVLYTDVCMPVYCSLRAKGFGENMTALPQPPAR
jgi:hypothetical protein